MKIDKYNILIVEDEFINAEFVAQFLASHNHNVVGIATNAKEAIQYVNQTPIDFAFMDININGQTDGIALSKQLNEKYPIPIIYMSAFGDSITIREAGETNIYGFLVKPFDDKDIEATLCVAVQRINKEKNAIQKESKDLCKILDLGKNCIYDLQKQMLYCENKPVSFSKNESKLIHLFCENVNQLVYLEHIHIYGWGEKNISKSTIRETILRIRKKAPSLEIHNIVGLGYSLYSAQTT